VAVANDLFPDRGYTAADTLKNVVLMLTYPDGTRSPLVVGLPGDREVDLKRLEAQVAPAVAAPFEEADFARYPQLVKGYIGPQALGHDKGIEYRVDPRVVSGTAWITGANQPGRHVFDLVCGRDFVADAVIEAAEVRDGDPAPDGSGPLHSERGIEIGHIFQLGRKYAEALDLTVLDENGKSRVVTMGSYGIGVSRAVAAIAEQHHDDKGLLWPREVAPADIHILATGKDPAVFEAAEELAVACEDEGLRVLYDDRRGVSPGVKFNDSELLGVPTIVVVGKKLVDGLVEIKDRATGEREEVALPEALGRLVQICRS
jgi:prolyl-tRNA synthetase